MHAPKLALTSIAASILFIAAGSTSNGQATASPSPSPSPTVSPAPSASPASAGYPLYDIAGEIFTIDRDTTAYYYFQANKDGSAKVKQELRYGRDLWNNDAQLRVRFPIITRFPVSGPPFSGFGNFEIGYSYSVKNKPFDHVLEIRAAVPTEGNGVESQDTQLKGFYLLKWKYPGWAINYSNEYDQTVIKPPGASWTSYYEGKLTLPDYAPVHSRPSFKISGIYNFRVLFDSGGLYKSAAGVTAFGGFNDMALSLIDTWGIGPNGLWRYKFEANFTVRY